MIRRHRKQVYTMSDRFLTGLLATWPIWDIHPRLWRCISPQAELVWTTPSPLKAVLY